TIGGSNSGTLTTIYTAATAIAKSSVVSFDWSYVSDDDYCAQNGSYYDQFEYAINGVTTDITVNEQGGGYVQSGSATINVPAGSVFDLRITSIDDQCGLGTVEISNLVVTEGAVECPIVDCFLRQYTATDDCGNISVFNQFVVTQDTVGPVFEGDNTIFVECSLLDTVEAPVVTDACSEVEVWHNDICISAGCPGGIQRTYTAVDACGNETTWVQYITLSDTTPPVIVAPAELTAECDNIPTPDAYAYDECTYQCLPEYDFNLQSSSTIVPGDCENSYDIVITWWATDYCENVGYATTIIHVFDTTDPWFTYCPENYSQECDEAYPAIAEASAEDNCDEDVEIEVTDNILPGECPNEYTIERVYRAFDNCGNEAFCVQYISIYDDTAPEFTYVPGAVTIECNTDLPYEDAQATDNCGDVTITYSDNAGGECDEPGYADLNGPCAASVCSYDPFCCEVSWDSLCASE
ncbi:MAG: hypothetical protein JNM00_01660, partial [Flavobacteriales bacterium]|nr:hypothetical protein [Flavobacteriales bacterium]